MSHKDRSAASFGDNIICINESDSMKCDLIILQQSAIRIQDELFELLQLNEQYMENQAYRFPKLIEKVHALKREMYNIYHRLRSITAESIIFQCHNDSSREGGGRNSTGTSYTHTSR